MDQVILMEASYTQDAPEAHAVHVILSQYVYSACAAGSIIDNTDTIESTAAHLISYLQGEINDFSSWRSRLVYFFAIFFHITKQCPHASSAQDHLIALLLTLQNQPDPLNVPQEFWDTSETQGFFAGLPMWRSVWHDLECIAPLVPPLLQRPPYMPGGIYEFRPRSTPWMATDGTLLSRSEWTNLNALLARLFAQRELMPLWARGLWSLLDALEEPLTAKQFDILVPAAAVWVIYAGTKLKACRYQYGNYRDDGSKRLPWSRGDLWHGEAGLSPERWNFWISRFQIITDQPDVEESTRRIAWEALISMYRA